MAKIIGKPGFYGWWNVGLLFFVYMVILGIVFYGFNVIFPAMIEAQGWGRGEAAWAHTAKGVLSAFLTPLVALFINRRGGRLSMNLGIAVVVVALVLLSTVTSKLWQWTILWGGVMPIGFAFGGALPIMTIVNFWFSKNRGSALGIVLTGASVGGFIAQPLFTWLIMYSGTWKIAWAVAAGLSLCALAVSFRIKNKPEDLGQYADGISPEQAQADDDAGLSAAGARTYRSPIDWTVRNALKTRALWMIVMAFLAQAAALYLVTVHGVLHLTDKGYTPMEAASFLSVLILMGGVARFPMGMLADRIEPRWILMVIFAVMAASFIGIWQAPGIMVLFVSGIAFGFSYGTCTVLFPAVLGNYYGPGSFANIFAFVAPLVVIFIAPVPVAAGYIADIYKNYDLAFIGITAFIMAAVICSALAVPPRVEKK
ncbi:MAG: MFS transporter [Deltaproteobacteria bacterium]|nr:MFS transporter [Deltaproteobacteria bacterium]